MKRKVKLLLTLLFAAVLFFNAFGTNVSAASPNKKAKAAQTYLKKHVKEMGAFPISMLPSAYARQDKYSYKVKYAKKGKKNTYTINIKCKLVHSLDYDSSDMALYMRLGVLAMSVGEDSLSAVIEQGVKKPVVYCNLISSDGKTLLKTTNGKITWDLELGKWK